MALPAVTAASSVEGLSASHSSIDDRTSTKLSKLHVSQFLPKEEEELNKNRSLLGNQYFITVVHVCIILNFVTLGFEADKRGNAFIWEISENVFVSVFTLEMLVKLYILRTSYFKDSWNIMDFMLAWMGIIDVWVLAGMDNSLRQLSAVRAFRLCRVFRLVRVLEIKKELLVLVEGMWASIRSLGWLGLLLVVALYTSALFVKGAIDDYDYDPRELDKSVLFENVPVTMLTLFSMCVFAEWTSVIWPVYKYQPHIFVYLMGFICLVSFGILNLVIGVIAERTHAATQEVLEEEEERRNLRKMGNIVTMANEIFDADDDGEITMKEMEDVVNATPALQSLLQTCDLPRGFDVADLHLIFDEQYGGQLSKDEFLNGMFRLIFNDDFQRSCCILMTIAQVKAMMKEQFDDLRASCCLPQMETKAGAREVDSAGPMATTPEQKLRLLPDADVLSRSPPATDGASMQAALEALAEAQGCLLRALRTSGAPLPATPLAEKPPSRGKSSAVPSGAGSSRQTDPISSVVTRDDPVASGCLCSSPLEVHSETVVQQESTTFSGRSRPQHAI